MTGALALASILHDTYGCRITCRGGRLANDRHPSHAEAYLDTASAVLASLGAAGWRLVRSTPASVQLDEIEARYKEDVEASNARIRELEEMLEWK